MSIDLQLVLGLDNALKYSCFVVDKDTKIVVNSFIKTSDRYWKIIAPFKLLRNKHHYQCIPMEVGQTVSVEDLESAWSAKELVMDRVVVLREISEEDYNNDNGDYKIQLEEDLDE